MYKKHSLSLVIPCLNEEKGLAGILNRLPGCIDEVIVIDNGSEDRTAQVAREGGAIVVEEPCRGYGRAYQAGLIHATGSVVITLDGDGSYPLEEIEGLLEYMDRENLDFVVGCRYPLADGTVQPLINKVANRFISLLIRGLFRLRVRDSQSGMMVFKRDLLSEMDLKHPGMGFSQEIKIKASLLKGKRCGEKRITYLPRIGPTKFRPLDGLNNLFSALMLFGELGSVRSKMEKRP